jgi:diacylglycerol kinase family enzyme
MARADRHYRWAAVGALGAALAALVVLCSAVRVHPWSMVGILAALPIAVVAGWHVVSRRGLVRVTAGLVVLVAVVAPVLHVLAHRPTALLVSMLLFGFSMAAARVALLPAGRRPRRGRLRRGPVATRSGRAVLLVNPRAGDTKATGPDVVDLARRSDVDVVAVQPGDDLAALAEAAVAAGAGVLGVAGGDGSMAPVAAVASRHGLPFVCVPAGTRNHFALDLGLDPHDLPHALTAFRVGVHHRVDLAEVNGQMFVNNASLGLYAAMVRSRHYRRSKLRAVLEELPAMIGPASEPLPLRFHAPDGQRYSAVHALLVSNNPYRLGGLGHSAWRPKLDSGSLGVLTVRVEHGRAAARLVLLELLRRRHPSSGYSRWTTETLAVEADETVAGCLDGEPATIESPLRFASRCGALVVRLPVGSPRRSVRRLAREARHLVRTAVDGGPRPARPDP